eukprot:1447728-Pyramimonas_sp.AAC.1
MNHDRRMLASLDPRPWVSCNVCCAIRTAAVYVVYHAMCARCVSIDVAHSMGCPPRGSIYVVRTRLCSLSGANCMVQSMLRFQRSTAYVVKLAWCKNRLYKLCGEG